MPVPARRVILGLFLLALVFHLSVIWQDFGVLAKNGFLYDDSFYAFKIASNIANGHGVTFDGINATNGFQPLYVFLLVPIFWLLRPDPIAPVYGALVLSALVTALTSVVLYGIVRRYVRPAIAVLVSQNARTVDAGYNRIDVRLDAVADTVRLKYHWDKGLKVTPPARISSVYQMDDPVPHILLEPNGATEVVITY